MMMDLAGGVASSNHHFLTLIPLLILGQCPATPDGSRSQPPTTAIRPNAVLQTNVCTVRAASAGSFLIQGLELLDQCVDFFRDRFAGVSGHPALAVSDDAAQVVGGGDFVGDQRWSAEVAAFCSLAVTLRTVFLEDSVLGQGRVRRRGLAEACSECEDQQADYDCDSGCFQEDLAEIATTFRESHDHRQT